jgi:hypothetical protein
MLLLAAMALSAAAPGNADWREFDRRRHGWAEEPAEYDAAGVTRRGERVRYRYTTFTSGVPDYRTVTRIEIDCPRRRTRVLESLIYGGIYQLSGREPYRDRRRPRPAPIEAGSMEDALARRLCAEGPL